MAALKASSGPAFSTEIECPGISPVKSAVDQATQDNDRSFHSFQARIEATGIIAAALMRPASDAQAGAQSLPEFGKKIKTTLKLAMEAVSCANLQLSSPQSTTRGCAQERAACIVAAAHIAAELIHTQNPAGYLSEIARGFEGHYRELARGLNEKHCAEEHWGLLRSAGAMTARAIALNCFSQAPVEQRASTTTAHPTDADWSRASLR